jgi:hypothetical protein
MMISARNNYRSGITPTTVLKAGVFSVLLSSILNISSFLKILNDSSNYNIYGSFNDEIDLHNISAATDMTLGTDMNINSAADILSKGNETNDSVDDETILISSNTSTTANNISTSTSNSSSIGGSSGSGSGSKVGNDQEQEEKKKSKDSMLNYGWNVTSMKKYREERDEKFDSWFEGGKTDKLLPNVDADGPILDFAIAGFAKCGTTSMEANLGYIAPIPIADVCTPIHQTVYYSYKNWPKEYGTNKVTAVGRTKTSTQVKVKTKKSFTWYEMSSVC